MERKPVTKREFEVYYLLDKMSISDIAHKMGLTFDEVKSCLKAYNITVRKNEKPEQVKPGYEVFLTDLDVLLNDVEKTTKKKTTEVLG